jgi:competence protein ComFB
MSFKNYMEDVVLEVFEDLKRLYPEHCYCERCSSDIMVLALSHLKGKYAASLQGEVFAKISRDDRQVRADALLMLMDAAKTVASQPSHDKT